MLGHLRLKRNERFPYVPDQPTLYPKLTGREYLKFIASIYQISTNEFEERSSKWLQLFQLTERADELIEGYSHGMKQKIALCGALIHNPEVLFLDEPTVGLDPEECQNTKKFITVHL